MNEPAANFPERTGSEIGAPPVIQASPRFRGLRWLWPALAVLAAALAALLFFFNPGEHSFYPFCVFHRMTGMDCPGCGGLRAAHQLLHGHFVTAFRLNPLVVTALPLIVVLAIRRWWRGSGQPVSHRAMARWAWVAFAVLVAFWILRNLPLEYFKLPPT